jgi:hypothetical protein
MKPTDRRFNISWKTFLVWCHLGAQEPDGWRCGAQNINKQRMETEVYWSLHQSDTEIYTPTHPLGWTGAGGRSTVAPSTWLRSGVFSRREPCYCPEPDACCTISPLCYPDAGRLSNSGNQSDTLCPFSYDFSLLLSISENI